MLKKNKKNLLLAGGLLSALITSSAVGIALSSCTTTSSSTTRPAETETEYTNSINWDDANSLSGLIKDAQGLVYSDESRTNVIALQQNSGVTTITIPSTVTTISGYVKVSVADGKETSTETGAFQGITSLTTITVASGSKLTTIDKSAFSGCTALTSIGGTTGVTKIGSSAFSGCTSLKAFNLTKVQSIGANAFKGCTAFDGAVNLSNVSSIGNNTFNGTAITSVDTSKNSWLTLIGNSAFDGCKSLTTVVLPNNNISSLTTIGSNAFNGCIALKTVAPSGKTGFYATSKVTSIGDYAFRSTLIESIDFSATSIDNANYSLNRSFNNMSMVASVKLPNTLKNIGQTMFNNCGNEGTGFDLVLPSSIVNFRVSEANEAPFANSGLKSIDMSAITSYDITSNMANVINDIQFYNATKLETVILKPGTTVISKGVFKNCSSLKVVREPNQSYTSGYVATSAITSIGDNAFSNAFAKDIGATIDLSATKLTTVPTAFSDSNITSIKLPSTAATVGANAFFGSGVTNLTFNASAITSSSTLFTGSGITANTDKNNIPASYKAASVPFGNNTALTNLNYTNFASTGSTAAATSAQTLFETTSQETWNAVAKIINSLSNYTYSDSDATSGANNIPANLSEWTADADGSASATSKILTDSTITSTATGNKISQIVFDKCFSTNSGSTLGIITIKSTANSNKFIHNGVTWTYSNDGNSITLTGQANMYKATVGNNSYLTFFNNEQVKVSSSGGTSTTYNIPSKNKVTVTLTIAAKSAA